MHQLQVSSRTTNLGMLALLLAGAATGLGSFLAGSAGDRWVVWLHSISGFALILLLVWKRRIVLRSLRRHGVGAWALPSLLLLGLLLASLLSGLLWSTVGLPSFAGETELTLHAAISVALAILLVPHARRGWPGVPRAHSRSRRALLRTGLFLGAAAVIWRGTEAMSAAAGLGGATRRFTGSRPAASFSGNDFPSNSWLLDSPKPLDLTAWHLSVSGAVKESFVLSHDDLEELDTIVATIDCTGGWFSTQQWTGVSLERLLARAAPARHARSVVIRSATGYWRRLPLDSSGTAVLASKVGGERLTHEHGSPARLVVPGSRGYDWVKWVTSIEVSAAPPWWKWPLPLS